MIDIYKKNSKSRKYMRKNNKVSEFLHIIPTFFLFI